MERFWSRVQKVKNGCWIWTGALHSRKDPRNAYGVIRFEGRKIKTHRLSYELMKGEIPKGMQVLHRCDNPQCVNPDHLFLGTQRDNIADMVAKGRQKGAVGVAHPLAKLNEDDVRAIRKDHRVNVAIAKDYGVTRSLIGQIKRRTSWTHVR